MLRVLVLSLSTAEPYGVPVISRLPRAARVLFTLRDTHPYMAAVDATKVAALRWLRAPIAKAPLPDRGGCLFELEFQDRVRLSNP